MPPTLTRPYPGPALAQPVRGLLALVLAALLCAGCQGRGVRTSPQDPGALAAAGAASVPQAQPTAGTDRFPGQTPGQDEDLRRLASPDFVVRSKAAERLVAAGGSALPGLGAAGPMPVPVAGGGRESATAPVVAAILARLDDEALAPLLGSPHATLRRAAAVEIGQRHAWAPVPALIDGLADPDPAVREAAHGALKRITGEALDPTGAGSRRERWRTWWDEKGRLKAQGQSETSAG